MSVARRFSTCRRLANNSKSYLPVFEGIFQPQTTYPSQFFVPANSWRLLLLMNVPLFDSGQRAAERVARQSSVEVARATLAEATTTAASEVRTAREAMASANRELISVRAAADQAARGEKRKRKPRDASAPQSKHDEPETL